MGLRNLGGLQIRTIGLALVVLVQGAACGSSSSVSDASADSAADSAVDTATLDAGFDAGPFEAGRIAAQRSCRNCHGASLMGGQNFGVCVSSNLHDLADEGWTEEEIVNTLRSGEDREGNALCSEMPKFTERQISNADAQNIARYLLSL